MNYDPDVLVMTAPLKYTSLLYLAFSLFVSDQHSLTHIAAHLIAPLSFPSPLFVHQLDCNSLSLPSQRTEEAINLAMFLCTI